MVNSRGLFVLKWDELPGVSVSLDEKTGSFVAFDNWSYFDRNGNLSEEGVPIEVGEAQAIETGLSVVRAANKEASRWLVKDPRLISTRLGQKVIRQVWSVKLFQEIDGRFADLDRAYVEIDPYSGVVAHFMQTERADRLPVEGPVIEKEVALRTATDAFYAATRGWVLSGATCSTSQYLPGVAYKSIAVDNPTSRLAYTYYFNVRQRDIESDGGDEFRAGYEVVVDAVTGEVWWAKCVTGGGGSNVLPQNPKFQACEWLLKNSGNREFVEILLASTPVKPTSMGKVVGGLSGGLDVSYTENGILRLGGESGLRCYEVPVDKRDWCRQYFESLGSLGHSF